MIPRPVGESGVTPLTPPCRSLRNAPSPILPFCGSRRAFRRAGERRAPCEGTRVPELLRASNDFAPAAASPPPGAGRGVADEASFRLDISPRPRNRVFGGDHLDAGRRRRRLELRNERRGRGPCAGRRADHDGIERRTEQLGGMRGLVRGGSVRSELVRTELRIVRRHGGLRGRAVREDLEARAGRLTPPAAPPRSRTAPRAPCSASLPTRSSARSPRRSLRRR